MIHRKGNTPARLPPARYVVADPRICHGKLTFRGTRVFVADVLDQVAEGMDWETISESWNGHVSREAIAEAIQLASKALLRHVDEFRPGA